LAHLDLAANDKVITKIAISVSECYWTFRIETLALCGIKVTLLGSLSQQS